MSESQIRDELLTLLFAGHETTAIALAWAMYWLHRHPATMERLCAEIAGLGPEPDPEALAGLPFLEAVCNETLRLYPIVPHVPRRVLRPFTLKGHALPVGIGVAVGICLLHQREDLYRDPQRFAPERFLERTYSPFEFLPFGGGARRCLGAAFALYEMKIALSTLARGPRLRLCEDKPLRPVRRSVVLGPARGVRMQRAG